MSNSCVFEATSQQLKQFEAECTSIARDQEIALQQRDSLEQTVTSRRTLLEQSESRLAELEQAQEQADRELDDLEKTTPGVWTGTDRDQSGTGKE